VNAHAATLDAWCSLPEQQGSSLRDPFKMTLVLM